MRQLINFQGPLITFNGGAPLRQAPEAVTNILGILGIALAIGTVIWLKRGGIEKLKER